MNAPLIHLPEVDSTNLWAKANLDKLAPAGVVWTTCQTAGRGRLGRGWTNAAGQGLYLTSGYTAKTVQPSTLPLFSALAVQRALTTVLGPLDLKVKWPNDLILNGKKLVGILCEGTAGGIVSGIGTNLAQDQAYFDALNLPHGTSLVLEGLTVNDQMIEQLAAAYAEELTGPALPFGPPRALRPSWRSTAPCASTWAAPSSLRAARAWPNRWTKRAA